MKQGDMTVDMVSDSFPDHTKDGRVLDPGVPLIQPTCRMVQSRSLRALALSRDHKPLILSLSTDLLDCPTLWLESRPYEIKGYRERMILGQQDGLEMTLETGLDKLSGQRRLEELMLAGMRIRMGVKRVEWMTGHWPRMWTTRRLDIDGRDKEVLEWLREHHPEIEVLRLR